MEQFVAGIKLNWLAKLANLFEAVLKDMSPALQFSANLGQVI